MGDNLQNDHHKIKFYLADINMSRNNWIKEKSVATLANRDIAIKKQKVQFTV